MPIKFVMGQIGIPNAEYDVVSSDEFEEEVEYKYPEYRLFASHYLGEVRNLQGTVIGYKMMLVLVKDSEQATRKTLKGA